jgi:hypothetical protein
MNITNKDFKISFTNTEFHVNTSGKTGKTVVTCTLTCVVRQPLIDNGAVFNTLALWGPDSFTVTAKAVCSDNDISRVEIGKAVAQAKAESKAYAGVAKFLGDRVTTGCAILAAALGRFEGKAEGVIAHNKKYIDEVTDPTTDLHKRKVAKENGQMA